MLNGREFFVIPLLASIHEARESFRLLYPGTPVPGACSVLAFALAVDEKKLASSAPSDLDLFRYLAFKAGMAGKSILDPNDVLASHLMAYDLVARGTLESCAPILVRDAIDASTCKEFLVNGKSGLVMMGSGIDSLPGPGHMIGGHFDKGLLCLGSIVENDNHQLGVQGWEIPIPDVHLDIITNLFGGIPFCQVWGI